MPDWYRERTVVLLVEDNPADMVMIREAFEQALTPVQLYVVSNGEQALKFVRRTDPGAPRPGLILLDLHLPVQDGLAVLAELKSPPTPRRWPGGTASRSPGMSCGSAASRLPWWPPPGAPWPKTGPSGSLPS